MWKPTLFARLCLCGVVAVSFTGCANLSSLSQSSVPTSDIADMPSADGKYMVEMKTSRGSATRHIGNINSSGSNPTTVQTALEESGAISKFSTMDITVFRRVEGAYTSLKMPVVFEPGRDAVSVEQDYALHSGDRIVIEQKLDGPVTQILNALTRSSL